MSSPPSVNAEYTALSTAGEAFVEGFTEALYREFIGEWKTLLDAYFAGLDS